MPPLSDLNTFPPERFEEVRRLGQGGMARVVLARDREMDRQVAIKWILRHLQEHVSAAQRFRNEARFLSAVEHPNLLRVYGCVEAQDGSVGLVMECVEGWDLDQELTRNGRLDPEEVRAVGIQVAQALDALHGKNIFHRDLKPANLMRRKEDGSIVVMDLGLARSTEVTRMTQTGYLVGTVLYMSPEVLRGGDYTAVADIYQLGVTMWELVTGETMIAPEASKGMDGSLDAILGGVRAKVDPRALGIPEDLWEAITAAVAVDPDARPPTAAAFVQVLRGDRSALGSSGPSALASQYVPGGSAPASHRGRLPWIVAALFLLGLSTALLLTPTGPPQDVRWRVVGGAVVVEAALEGPADLRIEREGEILPVEFRERDGRRRAVVPGLRSDRDYSMRLLWDGGQGPVQVVQGEPEAVGDIGFGGSDLLEVHARRPCEVGFGGDSDRLWSLLAGHHPLPAPPRTSPDFRLRWVEAGVLLDRTVTWSELFTREAQRLADQFSQVDVHASLVQANVHRTQPSFAAERSRWAPAVPWLPEVLGHPEVPRAVRRRLHQAFQVWERSVAEESFLGIEGAPLGLPQPHLGGRYAIPLDDEDPPLPDPVAGRRIPYDVPEGCRPEVGNTEAYALATPFSRTVPFGEFADACPAISWSWPDLGAAPGDPVRLWVRTSRLPSRAVIRVTTLDQTPPGVLVDLWRPEPREGDKSFRGWLGVTLPADLWPRPGQRTTLEVVDLLRPKATLAKIWRIRLDTPSSE